MAVLETIRVKLGILITILIAVALLSFIVDPNTLSTTFQIVSKANKVGEMNGKSISYQDFFTKLDANNRLMEAISGQSLNSEEAQTQLRNMTWQEFFDENVFLPKTKAAGIAVGDEEMLELTQGTNISSVLMQQPAFVDANGNFSREAFSRFVQGINLDESSVSQQYWDYLEKSIHNQQLYGKYYSLLQQSNVLSSAELEAAMVENNLTSDVDFVMVPMGYEMDSTITVSSAEINTYYNNHKNLFEQPANRDIEYVMYEVVASESDIEETREAFEALQEEFATTDQLKSFIALNSDTRWTERYFSQEDLKDVPEFAALFDVATPSTSKVIYDEGVNFAAARVVGFKNLPDQVSVDYAVFSYADEAKADSVVNVLNNKGTYEGMTSLGWVNQATLESQGMGDFMVAFDTPAGKAAKVKVSASQVILVLQTKEATAPVRKAQIALLTKNITPSEETYRDYMMKATDLADRSNGKYETFAQIVKDENIPVIPATNITEATRRIGAVDNAREVIRWAFDAKKGEVSDILTVDNKYYFVAAVTEIRKEGYASVKEVAPQISAVLRRDKQVEKLAADTKAKIEGKSSLEAIAETLGTSVSHQSGISFGSQTNALDPKFIGAIAAAQKGTITGPVAGDIGVYIFEVTDTQSGSYYTEADAATRMGQTAQYRLQALSSVLSKEAGVKDNRARFF